MGVTRLWSRGLARAWMWRFEAAKPAGGHWGEYREVAGLAERPLIVGCRAEAEGRGTNAAFRRMVRRRLPTSRANKQRYEPALECRNEVGGLAHVSSSSLQADQSNRRRGHTCSSALDDTVNAITIAIQFQHIVMAVTSPSCDCSAHQRVGHARRARDKPHRPISKPPTLIGYGHQRLDGPSLARWRKIMTKTPRNTEVRGGG